MARDIWDDLWTGLRGIAEWVGLGTMVDSLYIEAGGNNQLSTGEVNDMVEKIVREARNKGSDTLDELNNRLGSLMTTIPKSSNYRAALSNGLKEVKASLNKANDLSKQAESHLTSAAHHAATIDMLPETQKHSNHGIGTTLKDKATNSANKAKNLYEEMEKLI